MLPISTEAEIPSDLQNFVKQAMASVSDTLAAITTVAAELPNDLEQDSDISSAASILIGAASDNASKPGSLNGRPRSSSGSSLNIRVQVDYDAVAAAVNAAEAAAGAIDLATFTGMTAAASSSSSVSSKSKQRRQLPTQTKRVRSDTQSSSSQAVPDKARSVSGPLHIELPPIPKSKMDDRDMEIIRERARAAAGYVPPSSPSDRLQQPPKKKIKMDPETPGLRPPSDIYQTPRTSNTASYQMTPGTAGTPYTPALSAASSLKTPASKGQSSQKWDSMFDCLVQFIADAKSEETEGMSEEEIKNWIWDGNVPTTFKTKDGKALGRWVNNQRSAKSKGVLKDDRETRLVNAGLKWSVLASNSWNEMLEELRVYVSDQVRIQHMSVLSIPIELGLTKGFFRPDQGRPEMGWKW
jgi:hypothetical protein